MCSIMTIYGVSDQVRNSIDDLNNIIDILTVKGGDTYEFSLIMDNKLFRGSLNNLINIFDEKYIKNSICILQLFSRLTPEMESNNSGLTQPYCTTNSSTIVHGTIGAIDEIIETLNITDEIVVDTDIFNYKDFSTLVRIINKSGGKIATINVQIYKEYIEIKSYHNGLGLFKYADIFGSNIITNIDLDNNSNFLNISKIPMDQIDSINISNDLSRGLDITDVQIEESVSYVIIPLFSGGLDITCATQQAILDTNYNGDDVSKVDLIYFDWGTVANESEIQAGMKFKDFLSNSVDVEYSVIKIQNMFKDILSASGLDNTRLTNKNSKGAESAEAESAISYVPFRNTFLLTLAAARAEQLYPHKHVKFILGANLTEGMVYLDNSEPFITAMDDIVRLGGQSCEHFSVVAPFVNNTKTKMLEISLKNGHNIDTAFSCYFPNDDGTECGKCGSCILKNTAINKIKGEI